MAIIDIDLCGTQHVSKNESIKRLIDDHRKDILEGDENNGICYDGIVDERRWRCSEVNVAFLLKETNGNDNKGKSPEKQEDWDYMEWARRISTGEENITPPSAISPCGHPSSMIFLKTAARIKPNT